MAPLRLLTEVHLICERCFAFAAAVYASEIAAFVEQRFLRDGPAVLVVR